MYQDSKSQDQKEIVSTILIYGLGTYPTMPPVSGTHGLTHTLTLARFTHTVYGECVLCVMFKILCN
jgi:hypothetical protein